MMAKEDLWPGQGPTELLVYLNGRDGPFREDYPSSKIMLHNTVPTSNNFWLDRPTHSWIQARRGNTAPFTAS